MTFLLRTPFIVKMEFENMKIFASIFLLSRNILQGKFEGKLIKKKVKVTFSFNFFLKKLYCWKMGAEGKILPKFLNASF